MQIYYPMHFSCFKFSIKGNMIPYYVRSVFCPVLTFIVFLDVCHVKCEEIFGCGGFVKSNFSINYSRVDIKLYAKKGSLKYQTDCAPNNGYYLIPLYDKGDYILKIEPPHGWKFKPSFVDLHIDGTTDPCSRNQDINFVFMGFTVSGKVISEVQKNVGPPGILLSLKRSGEDEVVQQAESSVGGSYNFTPVLPGNYIIQASHNAWIFEEKAEHINVDRDNVQTANKIVIAGFDVEGFVFSEGEPIQGVHFLLFSKAKQKSPRGCNTAVVKGFKQKREGTYLCYVTSQSDGSFKFPAIPSGHYILIPFHKGEHIEFDVSPSYIQFQVEQSSFKFSEYFKVEGFSVTGRVLEAVNGKGVEKAKIYVNGKQHAITEANGVYHLENMRAGTYEIEIKMPHIFFEPVTRKVTANTPHLPEIFASKFSACGYLHIEKYPTELPKVSRIMTVKSSEQRLIENVTVDISGNFCTIVPVGKYFIRPVVSDIEKKCGIKFVPTEHVITISNSPVFDIGFTQFLATLAGKIKCIKKCGLLQVSITSVGENEVYMETVTSEEGNFYFEGCLPGKYVLKVIKDDWCFQSKIKEFVIVDSNVHNIELQQSGFQVVVSLSHPSSFKVKYPSGETHSIELQKAKNVLCLPEPGVYDLLPTGCHLYKTDVFKFDTRNPSEIEIQPVRHLVTGNILTELNVSDVKVFILRGANNSAEVIKLEEPVELKKGFFRYPFSMFSEPNTNLEVRATSSQLLFNPLVANISVSNDCVDGAIEIIGKKGVFISGSVTPALENVKMAVLVKKTHTLLIEVFTGKDGTFTVGPLDSENEYSVTAEKDGYFFTSRGSLANFQSFKLAEIIVEVTSESREPLSGVLLSLSGEADYRKNSLTRKNGKVFFIELSPGQYFLRPMLKEFQFQPPTKMIEVKEGTQVEVKIRGKRVAYSLFGVVNSLTGESEVGVTVEAIGIGDEECRLQQEEAISEQGGAFRIRGLQPGCQYSLGLKNGSDSNQHIERVTPEEIFVMVTDSDIDNIRLIVFRHFGQMDVSGSIIANQEYLPTLKVRLQKEDNPDQVLHTVTVGKSGFFFLPSMPVDFKMYILHLDSSLSNSAFSYDLPFVTFCANTSFQHFTFSFKPHPRTTEQELTQSSTLALPLALLIIVVIYNYNVVLNLVAQVFHNVPSFVYTPQSHLSAEYTSSDVNTRRKIKARKM